MNNFDLIFERRTTLSESQLWKAWTRPELLMKWFCPQPWKVTDCRIDLKPGGEFFTCMEGPNGEKMLNAGAYLEVIENRKLVWTNMLTSGYQPTKVQNPGFAFVAVITFEKAEDEVLYKAVVRHADADSMNRHQTMGFQEGWGAAFRQLEELLAGI